MKFFIYKSFILALFFFLVYHLTIGYHLNKTKIELYKLLDKEKIEYFREKIKIEINESLNKDRILSVEDALLLKKFISKINNEIKN